jgi:transcriptional regulator with XRE-family HTH domain
VIVRVAQKEVPSLAAVAGRNLRKHRQERGLRQDDVAHSVRKIGLDWSRAVVAAIETGGRALDLGELVLLSVALGIGLSDLLQGDGDVLVGGRVEVSLPLLRALLDDPDESKYSAISLDLEKRSTVPSGDALRFERAVGEAERRAARRLQMSPLEVSRCAFQLWGRSLTEERDRRVVESGPVLGKSVSELLRSERALRGHVTRELDNALKAKITADETTSTKPESTTSSMPRQKSRSRSPR